MAEFSINLTEKLQDAKSAVGDIKPHIFLTIPQAQTIIDREKELLEEITKRDLQINRMALYNLIAEQSRLREVIGDLGAKFIAAQADLKESKEKMAARQEYAREAAGIKTNKEGRGE